MFFQIPIVNSSGHRPLTGTMIMQPGLLISILVEPVVLIGMRIIRSVLSEVFDKKSLNTVRISELISKDAYRVQ